MNPSSDIETLWQAHHTKLLNYVKRRVTVDAEDVAQEVWLRVCEAMQNGYGYRDHASGWLYRIAHNLVIDLYRARQRTVEQIDIDAPVDSADDNARTVGESILSDEPGPDELAERSINLGVLQAALPVLTNDQRQVILMRLAGFDYDEIADITGNEYQSVRQLQRRSAIRLRPYFDADYVAPLRDRRKKKGERLSPVAAMVRDTLMTHGPLLVSGIAKQSGTVAQTINNAIQRNRYLFVVVGHQQCYGFVGKVWGVRGIHDQEQAA